MDKDLQKLVLDQLRTIADEVKHLPELQARLNALDKSTREMIAELRTRDQMQQQVLDSVRLQQSEMMAAIAGVSATVTDLKFNVLEQDKRLTAMESQLVAPDTLRKLIGEMENNRPWIDGLKWFLRVLFGLLATAAGIGLLWLLAQSILGTFGG